MIEIQDTNYGKYIDPNKYRLLSEKYLQYIMIIDRSFVFINYNYTHINIYFSKLK